jgi:peptidoglycan/LPS O-acetylase OafA/YrhL
MAFVRRSASRAWTVLGVVGVANVGWLAVLQWVPAPSGAAGWFWVHGYEILPTYSMYVLAGCYAAVHLAKIQDFVDRHQRSLLIIAAAGAAGAVAAYAAQLPSMAPRSAASVMQPATTLSCVAALICTFIVGSRWAGGLRRHSATVATLSDVSFGVYLSHPLVLQLLADHGLGNNGQKVTPLLATAVGWLVAVGGGIAVSMIARRTPLSVALTGRPRPRTRPSEAAAYPTPARPRVALAPSQTRPSFVLEPAQIRQRG